jgi:signal transduction histidine kinase
VTIPFAGLAPDERIARGSGELAALDLQTALALGQQLRRACRAAQTTRQVAATTVDLLNSFDHDQRPACVLVRAFITESIDELPAELQAEVRTRASLPADARPTCLRLVATRGIEPAWNEVDRSEHHRAVVFSESSSLMVAEVARQLRYHDAASPPVTTFFVADPKNSPAIVDKEFVTAFDVRAVFGFGARASSSRTMIVVAFCRAPIELRTARLFEIIAFYARVAWLKVDELRGVLGAGHERALVAALEDTIGLYERLTSDTAAEHRRTVDQLRLAAQNEAKAASKAADDQARHLSRMQRAMLNVIDDLRQARESLAATVEVRTRELAVANRQLEARNRELEEFVYIASHDLQEPLRTVGGYLQMVQRRYGNTLGVDADEFIRYAIEGAQRMQALIESLLQYSRVTSTDRQLERVPLEDALAVAMKNLALRIEETKTVVERSAQLPTVRGDRIQLAQLFQNLLSNAIKFSGPKPPRVHISSSVDNDTITVEVRDEGIGFNPRFADRIFKIFRRLRRDTPGTGIGLAVCKKIVERHGGTIVADAKPNEGATFTIRLPVAPNEGA